jgi:hypothetical protein
LRQYRAFARGRALHKPAKIDAGELESPSTARDNSGHRQPPFEDLAMLRTAIAVIACLLFTAPIVASGAEKLFTGNGHRCQTAEQRADGRLLSEWGRIAMEAKAESTRERAAGAVLQAVVFHVESIPTIRQLTSS